MDRSGLDQAVELLTRAQRGVLIAIPTDPPADAFAGALALALALENLGKQVAVVSPTHVPRPLQFLPGTSQVKASLPQTPELRLELPLGGRRPDHVHWEVVGDHLHITVHPERDLPFPESEVRVRRGGYPWDLIVTVGVPRLHALGDAFTQHTRFFYDTPLVNLDRGAANEFYGTANVVPATTGTVTEVIADVLDTLGGANLLTRDVATCLLAGLVAGTDSFRAPNASPRAFTLAAHLLSQEADRAAVVRHLFHTHTLAELRLLGRALVRLEERDRVLVSVLEAEELTGEDVTPDLVPPVFQELLEWAGERRPAVLAFQRSADTLEALVSLGRVSADDRDTFRAATHGIPVGPFVLVNLGRGGMADAVALVEERIVPRLPQARVSRE